MKEKKIDKNQKVLSEFANEVKKRFGKRIKKIILFGYLVPGREMITAKILILIFL